MKTENFKQIILDYFIKKLKIPPLAAAMFRSSRKISGLNSSTLPKELIPLNSIQLSRGLLNYALIQSKMDWIYPYWVNKQFNPEEKSFLPRSHSGLSLNLTYRNWTAAGNPECDIEPIVDPRGLLTPFHNGWSVDTWLMTNDKIFFPSFSADCNQRLIEDLPVIETIFTFEAIKLRLISFTQKDLLVHKVSAENISEEEKNASMVISIRPFNPEGAAPVNSITFNQDTRRFKINENQYLFFDKKPDIVHCSDFVNGDSAGILFNKKNNQNIFVSRCSYGFASGLSVFNINLKPGETYSVQLCIPLIQDSENFFLGRDISHDSAVNSWNKILEGGTEIITPDKKLNSLIKASLSTLLMLTDKESITPGPFTYHQFWFRDAVFMLAALDKYGFNRYTLPIIKSFPDHQSSSGYFRSQKGEWDSNGQVLWLVYNHYLLNRDKSLLNKLFNSLYRGVKWIDSFRLTGKEFTGTPFYGLLPKGISAEHLGHADYYFWDNFWSLAGIRSFIKVCDELGKVKEKLYSEDIYNRYKKDVEKAVEYVRQKNSIKEIPASPLRNIDCGMIGSVCAAYPLQLFSSNDEKIISTLDALKNKFFYEGLFFQQFIHSGMNPYLTLHVAHSYLYAGDRKKFWEIYSSVVLKASPALNYPEAIHPLTGGGVMGDGHHGWASAEVLSAIRDTFIFENEDKNEAVLLQGIPAEWFEGDKKFYIKNAPVSFGLITIIIECFEEKFTLKADLKKKNEIHSEYQLRIKFPFRLSEAKENETDLPIIFHDDYSEVIIAPRSCRLTFIRSEVSSPFPQIPLKP